MADQNSEQLDPEIIERLMMTDPAFMAKISDVKTRIYDNLTVYADSIKDSENGMFTSEEVDEMTSAKDSVMKSWDALQNRLNVDFTKAIDIDDIDDGGDTDEPSILKDIKVKLSKNDANDDAGPSMLKDIKDKLSKNDANDDARPSMLKDIKDKLSKNDANDEGVFESKATNIVIEKIGKDALEQLAGIQKGDKEKKKLELGGTAGGILGFLGGIGGSIAIILGMKKAPSWLLSAAKSAGAMAPVALIAGGLIWAAMNGIKGFFKAEEWGTSKTSSALGGMFGSVKSGIEGAMANLGPWALVGAGVGLAIGSIPGAIAGGLIGAAIGGVLGWIGGEKIATTFDKIGAWFSEKWSELTVGFKDGILEGIGYFMGNLNQKFIGFLINTWNGIIDFFKNLDYGAIWDTIKRLPTIISDWFSGVVEKFKGWWKKLVGGWKKGSEAEVESQLQKEIRKNNIKDTIESRTSGSPSITSDDITESQKKTEEAIALSNKLLADNAEATKAQMLEQGLVSEKTLALLEALVDKPIASGGGGEVSLDFGEIRESTFDASHSFRVGFHSKRGM